MNDRTFLQAFEAATIPAEAWNHRAHIRMAFLYLRDYPFNDAISRIRAGIQHFNQAHQKPETPTSGYHETLTVGWARVIAGALQTGSPIKDFETFIAATPQLLNKNLLWRYYSTARILSPQAKATFVEPDIQALPPIPSLV
ncbi:MAG: hypothetical protein F6J95_004490 [Leptolyngbya sp. SIO1E4]|nr:hypothetical protein [Leptolyngbya sp. SIO1E4]